MKYVEIRNKETGVVKKVEGFLASDYVATKAWEVVKAEEKKTEKKSK